MRQPRVGSTHMREAIPAHFDSEFNPAIWRSGIVPVPEGLVLLVSMDKGYTNRLLDDGLRFRWTSQNQTKKDSKRGRQLHDGRVFLFVRARSKIKSKAAPFTYLGEVEFDNWSTQQAPITFTWKLKRPLDEDLVKELQA